MNIDMCFPSTLNINFGYYGNIADRDLPNGRLSPNDMCAACKGG